MFSTRTLKTLVLLLALVVIGCSDEDENPTDAGAGKPPAAMVGSWTLQSVTVNGGTADLATVLEWHQGVVAAKFHFQANGAYVYEEVDTNGGQVWFESGFVFIDGTEIDINIQMDGDGPVTETSRVAFTLTGGVLTFTEVDQGNTSVFTMTM